MGKFLLRMGNQPPPAGELWLWPGALDDKGYGIIYDQYRRRHLAHRVSWQIFNGPIPDGLVVRHSNDTPTDVNPHNLLIGTQAENIGDMMSRSRGNFVGSPGEKNGRAVLTQREVDEIRLNFSAGGVSKAELARRYGVTPTMIAGIISHKYWRD